MTAAGAQRGPGLASRQREAHTAGGPAGGRARSTRAGTRVPATDLRAELAVAALLGRSTRAGTRVPATAIVAEQLTQGHNVLAQRGPGLASRQRHSSPTTRNRKLEPAQRGPGLASRQRERQVLGVVVDDQARSTRAGTRVPATAPSSTAPTGRSPHPLNEGRDSRPGNG